MRLVASRLALWWAAPAALLSLFLPAPLGSWLAALAVLAAGLSLSLRKRWKLAPLAPAPETRPPVDEACLLEAIAQIVRSTTHARDLGEALHATARVLVHELGADGVLTGRLDLCEPQWSAGRHGGAGPSRPGALAAQATRSGEVSGEGGGYAVPVLRDGRSIAWIELRSVELPVERTALVRLLGVVQRELGAVAARCAEPQRAVQAEAPAAASGAGCDDEDLGACRAVSRSGQPGVLVRDAVVPLGASRPAADAEGSTEPGAEPAADTALAQALLTRYLQCSHRGEPGRTPADADAARRAFDPAALQRLHELDPLGLNRLHERVIHAFENSTARLLPQMSSAGRSGDAAALRPLACTMKSAADSVGAVKLATQCADIVAMSHAESASEILDRIDGLVLEIQVVLSVLRGQRGPCPWIRP